MGTGLGPTAGGVGAAAACLGQLGAELGSLEAIEAALADPDPSKSSQGSWANECERADAALAATEAQMGTKGERQDDDTSLAAAEAQMEKEDRELLVTLEAAMAPLRPCQAGPRAGPPARRGTPCRSRGHSSTTVA